MMSIDAAFRGKESEGSSLLAEPIRGLGTRLPLNLPNSMGQEQDDPVLQTSWWVAYGMRSGSVECCDSGSDGDRTH